MFEIFLACVSALGFWLWGFSAGKKTVKEDYEDLMKIYRAEIKINGR